ncbi:PREDICTED: uncharacterized protein LOC109189303 [Ipomoea nil]|uniref:uncharacterized protein LOC109189303 n=1 Tax=Ipomoea nil TaxID=35883 RepID=UPI0009010817|nr:PREDICTED: uncharacterized protein LOC109189303 [Ipomoea nil]
MATIMEVIWASRNESVWRNVSPAILPMRNKVLTLQSTWQETFSSIVREGTATTAAAWKPPPRGNLKCNVDAAIFSGGAGFSAVLRDHTGSFVAAKSGHVVGIQDPFIAELIAAKEALTWLKGLQSSCIIIESDCLNFCNAFNSSFSDYSYVGLLVKQCLSIANGIGDVSVRHVKRSTNQVAHELARATGSLAVSGELVVIPPTCISDFLSY